MLKVHPEYIPSVGTLDDKYREMLQRKIERWRKDEERRQASLGLSALALLALAAAAWLVIFGLLL